MISEFFGLPGSGKTSMVNELLDSSMDNIFQPRIRGRQFKKIFYMRCVVSSEYIKFVLLVGRLFIRKKNRENIDVSIMKSIFRIYLIYMQSRYMDDKKHIFCFDHGLIQTILSLVWKNQEIEDDAIKVIEYICKHLSEDVAFVYTYNDSEEELNKRMKLRGEDRRILQFNHNEMVDLIKFQQKIFDYTINIAEKDGIAIKIDTNSKPIEENVVILKKFFNKHGYGGKLYA